MDGFSSRGHQGRRRLITRIGRAASRISGGPCRQGPPRRIRPHSSRVRCARGSRHPGDEATPGLLKGFARRAQPHPGSSRLRARPWSSSRPLGPQALDKWAPLSISRAIQSPSGVRVGISHQSSAKWPSSSPSGTRIRRGLFITAQGSDSSSPKEAGAGPT